MSESGTTTYESPEVTFFSAQALNSITVTMSGGGGYTPPTPFTQSFYVFQQVYGAAWDYLGNLSTSQNYLQTVLNANILTLAFFRSDRFDADHFDMTDHNTVVESVMGLSWRLIAGTREEAFLEYLEDRGITVNPEQVGIIDPVSRSSIEITHYAATLGACISLTLGINISFLERNIDAYAGWAGDICQLSGILQSTLDNGGYDYFTIADVKKFVGATPGSLNTYHLYNRAGTEMTIKDAGFSRADLLQDVDAYNISKLYDLSSIPIYTALDRYYNIYRKYKNRYTLFSSYLLEEFGEECLEDVVEPFARKEIPVLSSVFEYAFGGCDQEYSDVISEGFARKIEQLSLAE